MAYTQIYQLASQAMNIEKLRVDIVANNIANQHSLKSTDGKIFKAKQVLATAQPFNEMIQDFGAAQVEVVEQNLPPNKVYQPGHAAADAHGFVTYPSINTVDEMTTLLKASRAYEANIKIINAAHSLYMQALTIGEER